jgi:hypothetical protein
MQVKKIVSLCALACAAMAGSSAHAALSAAAIADLNAAVPNGRVVFISGASAVQKGFASIIASTFTAPIYYSVQGGGKSSKVTDADFVAVSGTLAAGTGTWAGQKAVVIYRVKGGSVWGVNPVARNESIESMLINSTDCGTSGSGTAAAPYSCGTTTMIPDAGVSDVAPKHFVYGVNTEGEIAAAALSDSEIGVLTSTPLYGLAFGIPVTNTVPDTVKFNRATIAAIMSGNVGTWSSVANAGSGDIIVCRRVPGSGTQAVYNMWANNTSCPGNAQDPVDRYASNAWDDGARTFTYDPASPKNGVVVIENSTSGNVRDCLNAAVNGGTYSTSDRDGQPVTVTFAAGGNKAIGTLSMDSLKDSLSAGMWQFRALDGVGKLVQDTAGAAPTTVLPVGVTTGGKVPAFNDYENGDWDLQGWISFNVPARTTGAKLAFLNKFVSNAQATSVLQATSDLKFVAAGIPSNAGVSGPFALDAEYLGNDQCSPYQRNYND